MRAFKRLCNVYFGTFCWPNIMQVIKQLLDEVEHDIIFYTESDV